jgi:DMSO/TMAO reductase YedYZ molybdopterin-dependent catalytic subunit
LLPFRNIMAANENIFNKILSDKHLAKEYPLSEAVSTPRVNGYLGMGNEFDASQWELIVVRKNGDTLRVSLDQIKKLPKKDLVFNFKCIEGWCQVSHWAGARFSDFISAFGLQDESALKYVGMSTPDKQYYVGIDMPSALHPQTLLCYEMNGKPLPMNQGYPLRLIIPVKYGVKSIKRIGTMLFSDSRPPDYWSDKKGYDYFSGL